MSVRENTDSRFSKFLFFIWPFLALVMAIREYKAVWAKNIVWLFVIFFGFTLTLIVTDEESSADGNRYKQRFIEVAAKQVSFENLSNLFYEEDSQVLDILESIIIFTVSRFTGDYHILFAIFGLIFGYFYSRNIWYLIDRAGNKMVPENIPIILTFAFIVGFWEINGFRFWTATHIFLFGALPYFIEGKKKYLFFCALAVLMHFSYLLPLAMLAIFIFIGNRTTIYFALFIVTFFIKELNLGQVNEYLTSHLPEIFLPRVKGYVNEDYAQGITDTYAQANWYVVWYQLALKWTVAVFFITVFFTKKDIPFKKLFGFTLLLYSFANIFSLIPSGGRFISLANLFSLAFIFFYVQYASRGRALKRLIPFAIPALFLYSIVSLRIGVEAMGIFCLFGNPLLSVFIDPGITVLEIIKGIFT